MKSYASKYIKKNPKKYKKKSSYPIKKVSPTIKKYVSRVVHSQIENKHALSVTNSAVVTAYTFSTTLGVTTCLPTVNISQSLGQSGRIGNTIKTRKLMFNFYLYPLPFADPSNTIPKPQEVLIFLGKVKGQKDRTPITTDFQKLWQNGNSSTQPYSDLRDLTQIVNKDYWIVYKVMRFKIGTASYEGFSTTPLQVPQQAQQYYANNDFKLNVVRRMNITKYCPKTLKFNDTTLSPSNDNLFMWHLCVNSDGSVASSPSPINIGYSFQYEYEDA